MAAIPPRVRGLAARAAGERGRTLYRQLRDAGSTSGQPPATPTVAEVRYLRQPSASKPRVLGLSIPPAGYEGQLTDEYQQLAAQERDFVDFDDCYFYHSITLSDGREVRGPWDLRGREDSYLGHTPIQGKRILELGPASGYMSMYMADQGADVVAFDAGFDCPIDIVPYGGKDISGIQMDQMLQLGEVQNSWWYLHRDRHSTARMVYGNIYDLPGDLGTFDIATFQAILLHLRRPFDALEQAARRTTGAIIVTESVDPATKGSSAVRFHPNGQKSFTTSWWSFTPGAIEDMLDVLGFHSLRRYEHTQVHHIDHHMDTPPAEIEMFTVVGER